MQSRMKAIYSYSDYRNYLRDYYRERKAASSGFTYARFSKMAKLGSSNYSQLIMEGRRNLTVANIHHFADALDPGFEERCYFEALVLSNQAEDAAERAFHRRKMRMHRPSKGKSKGKGTLKLKSDERQSEWYFPAVLVASHGRPVLDDPADLARMIGISRLEVERALATIREKGLLQEIDGKYHLDFGHVVWHDNKLSNIHQKRYLAAQLQRSSKAFGTQYESSAKFHSHTFTAPAGNVRHYAERINAFVATLIAEADAEPAEKVVQLNTQLFELGG
jgi:uncharacterized protein (TIGR02147 family)